MFTGHGFLRTPNDIMSYSALAAIAIHESNPNRVRHGGQSLPGILIYYLAPGVVKTFRKQLKQMLYDYLELEGLINLLNFKKIEEKVNKLESIVVAPEYFEEFYKETPRLKEIFTTSIEKAYQKTDKITYQAMEAIDSQFEYYATHVPEHKCHFLL